MEGYNYIVKRCSDDYIFLYENKDTSKVSAMALLLTNPYMSNATKQLYHNAYCIAHKTYYAFKRLLHIYKYKRAITVITTDVFLENINPKNRNSMVVYQDGSKYWFTIPDLVKIIINAITRSVHFYSSPVEPKNPYNNVPFSREILYNIYFTMTSKMYSIPHFIQDYFYYNFDKEMFALKNEHKLREQAIHDYVYKTSHFQLHDEICYLLYSIFSRGRHSHKFSLSSDIPKEQLVSIMRPYFYLKLMIRYYFTSNELYSRCEQLYRYMVSQFVTKYYRFGRKYTKIVFDSITNTQKRVVYFNLDHPGLIMGDFKKYSYMIPPRYNSENPEIITYNETETETDDDNDYYNDEDDDDEDEEEIQYNENIGSTSNTSITSNNNESSVNIEESRNEYMNDNAINDIIANMNADIIANMNDNDTNSSNNNNDNNDSDNEHQSNDTEVIIENSESDDEEAEDDDYVYDELAEETDSNSVVSSQWHWLRR